MLHAKRVSSRFSPQKRRKQKREREKRKNNKNRNRKKEQAKAMAGQGRPARKTSLTVGLTFARQNPLLRRSCPAF